MPARKKQANVSFDSLLDSTTVDAPKKKSSSKDVPQIKAPDNVKKAIKNFLKHKKDMKAAETSMRLEERTIIDHCQRHLEDEALKGNYVPTWEVVADDETVKYVTADSFSFPQDAEVQESLKEIIGDEYDDITEVITTVTLKPEVFTDEKLKKKLVSLIGNEFATFFQTEKKVKLKSGFAQKLYNIAKGTREKLEEIKELLPQKKASIK